MIEFIETTEGSLVVMGKAPCGQEFEVGLILEPTSVNPVLDLKGPFGTRGLAELLDALSDWQEAHFKSSAS